MGLIMSEVNERIGTNGMKVLIATCPKIFYVTILLSFNVCPVAATKSIIRTD